jgi:N4-gp56 family major capsid protein
MRLLTRAVANFAYAYVAQLGTTPKTVVPKNRGDTIHWRKFSALSVATTPLDEGQTPTSTDVTVTSITDTVDEYGAWISYSDMLTFKSIDPILVNYAELLGEQVGDTIDQLTRDVAAAQTTNVSYAGGKPSRETLATTDVLDSPALFKALRSLENANARPLQNNNYLAVIHPYTWYDLRQDSSIYSIMEQVYPRDSKNPLLTGYIGTVYGIDFYKSTNSKVYAAGGVASNDVHATMIFGKDAMGIGGLGSMMPGKITSSQYEPNTGKSVKPVEMLITRPEQISKDDPLGQRGTIGWRTTFAAKLLDENFMCKIEHGVTA